MSKWAFQCAKRWHEPNPDFPGDALPTVSGKLYVGRICKHCGCFYAVEEGTMSKILDPKGVSLVQH